MIRVSKVPDPVTQRMGGCAGWTVMKYDRKGVLDHENKDDTFLEKRDGAVAGIDAVHLPSSGNGNDCGGKGFSQEQDRIGHDQIL